MRRLFNSLPYLLISACVLAIYWTGLGGGFFFDDFPNLVYDPDWRISHLNCAQLKRAMWHGISSQFGRPLAMLSFGLNHYFTGLATAPMKLTNVLMHAVNSGLVYALSWRLLSRVPNSPGLKTLSRLTALALALAWALHPLQVSSVLYIVQRMELGAQLFTLVALLFYLAGRRVQIEYRENGWLYFIACAMAIAAGLGFKETILLVPAYFLLIEVFILNFKGRKGVRSRAWLSLYITVIIAAALMFLLVLLPRYGAPQSYAFRDFTLVERSLTQLPILAMYLKLILLPLPQWMLFYYDSFPISHGLFFPGTTAAAATLLAALLVIAVLVRKQWPLTSLGIFWFFVAHAMTSNIIPLELAYEHRNYLALLGPLFALVQPLGALTKQITPHTRAILAALPLAALAFLCALQVSTWADPMRLASSLATRNPESPRATYGLASQLFELAKNDTASPQWSLARQEFQHVMEIDQHSILGEQALVIMAWRSGQAVEPAVWDSIQGKLTQRPVSSQEVNLLFGLVQQRLQLSVGLDDEQLFKTLKIALTHNLKSPVVHAIYANFAWNVMEDKALAIRVMRNAVSLAPKETQFRVGLTRFLLASKLPKHTIEADDLIAEIRAANSTSRFSDDLEDLEKLRHQALNSGDY